MRDMMVAVIVVLATVVLVTLVQSCNEVRLFGSVWR